LERSINNQKYWRHAFRGVNVQNGLTLKLGIISHTKYGVSTNQNKFIEIVKHGDMPVYEDSSGYQS
jgi:hypothetical protein